MMKNVKKTTMKTLTIIAFVMVTFVTLYAYGVMFNELNFDKGLYEGIKETMKEIDDAWVLFIMQITNLHVNIKLFRKVKELFRKEEKY